MVIATFIMIQTISNVSPICSKVFRHFIKTARLYLRAETTDSQKVNSYVEFFDDTLVGHGRILVAELLYLPLKRKHHTKLRLSKITGAVRVRCRVPKKLVASKSPFKIESIWVLLKLSVCDLRSEL